MLNSDWPIGPVGIKTLATPDMVDPVAHTMDGMWWDRPYTLAGVGHRRQCRPPCTCVSSYGARQDIELHTDDDSLLVDRFVVTTQTPPIESWADVDAVLSKTGARYSYRVSKVDDGRCEQLAGHQHRRISAAGIDFQVCTCCTRSPKPSRPARCPGTTS